MLLQKVKRRNKQIVAVILSAAIIMTNQIMAEPIMATTVNPSVLADYENESSSQTIEENELSTEFQDLSDECSIDSVIEDESVAEYGDDTGDHDESVIDEISDPIEDGESKSDSCIDESDDSAKQQSSDDYQGKDEYLTEAPDIEAEDISTVTQEDSSVLDNTSVSKTKKEAESKKKSKNIQGKTTDTDQQSSAVAPELEYGTSENGNIPETVITIPVIPSTSGWNAPSTISDQGMTKVERKIQEYKLTAKIFRTTTETVTELDVRAGKGKDSACVGSIKAGGVFFLLSEDDEEWAFIEAEDNEHNVLRGYVKRELITDENALSRFSQYGNKYRSYITVKRTEKDNPGFGAIKKTVYQHVVDEHTTTTSMWVANATQQSMDGMISADRDQMVQYSLKFLGNPYVWGGESLTDGCDCSGFTMQIYRKFGIELPRCSYEQAEVGTKIEPQDALPGDLLFYQRDGTIYHVLMYIGNGQAINASSSTTGIIISNVDYSKTCWGIRMIEDEGSSTQAIMLASIGKKAYLGDDQAKMEIIEALSEVAQEEWKEYGFLPSVLIARVIQESEWLSFNNAIYGGIQPEDNNVLCVTEKALKDQLNSPWSGTAVLRNVLNVSSGKPHYDEEAMMIYEDLEDCLCDYASLEVGVHPELINETDVDTVIELSLDESKLESVCQEDIKEIIEKYNLTKYDVIRDGEYATDTTNYTQDEIELIWAIVAQEDDTSYEGALAVISSAMNRADKNYGGYGTSVLEQLTADGQYCYSPKVSDPSLYQRRLGGNVDEYVKQAVSDCLKEGVRNNDYLNFRSSNRTGQYEQIGGNWYF